MRLLCISDIHGHGEKLEAILRREAPADVIVLGGDLTQRGTPGDAAALLAIARDYAPEVVAVAGNSDSRAIDDYLIEQGAGIHGFARRIEGVTFVGLSGVPRGLPWHYRLSEAAFAETLQMMAPTTVEGEQLVLVTHTPPKGILDRTYLGSRAGSVAIRNWIVERQPSLDVCGHIHEAQGTMVFGETQVVNCGPGLKLRYALCELGPPIEAVVH